MPGAIVPATDEITRVIKVDLLGYLDDVPGATGFDVAQEFGVPYPIAAMALLRLARHGLASRVRNHHALYAYVLTDRGRERLTYLEDELEDGNSTDGATSHAPEGGSVVKRKKLHNGLYHCPRCFVELDLFSEESLKCDDCGGLLTAGPIDDEFDDDEEE
jgi:DNA-binding MarR family transcriptional regulator